MLPDWRMMGYCFVMSENKKPTKKTSPKKAAAPKVAAQKKAASAAKQPSAAKASGAKKTKTVDQNLKSISDAVSDELVKKTTESMEHAVDAIINEIENEAPKIINQGLAEISKKSWVRRIFSAIGLNKSNKK